MNGPLKFVFLNIFLLPVFGAHAVDCDMDVREIRPTQFTVGLREIKHKEEKLRRKSPAALKDYLREHPIEGVLGPGGQFYATDGHHLGRAAWNIGVKKVCKKVLKDYSKESPEDFWTKMEKKGYLLLKVRGQGPMPAFLLPRRLDQMTDDPYRSLASDVKRAGGFAKSKIHYAEFQWADFFRNLVTLGESEADYLQAVEVAYVFAKSNLASELPGYSPDEDITCEFTLKTAIKSENAL